MGSSNYRTVSVWYYQTNLTSYLLVPNLLFAQCRAIYTLSRIPYDTANNLLFDTVCFFGGGY